MHIYLSIHSIAMMFNHTIKPYLVIGRCPRKFHHPLCFLSSDGLQSRGTAVHGASQKVKGGAQKDPLISEHLASKAFTLLLKLLYMTQSQNQDLALSFAMNKLMVKN